MKRCREKIGICFTLFFAFSVLYAESTILYLDPAKNVSETKTTEKTGYFKGVLPEAWDENYSTWSPARVTCERREDANGSYLHFHVEKAQSQFLLPCRNPHSYVQGMKLAVEIVYRSTMDGDFTVDLRCNQNPWPSFGVWKFPATGNQWKTVRRIVTIREKVKPPLSIYFLHQGVGDMDIRSVAFIVLNESELMASATENIAFGIGSKAQSRQLF